MFCPDCGTENQSESRFCVNCGRGLQVAVATVEPKTAADETPTSFEAWAAGFADEGPTDNDRGSIEFGVTDNSPETVFVPTVVARVEAKPAVARRMSAEDLFEDDEADDDFEQSLSGLKLEDLAEPAPVESPATTPPPDEVIAVEAIARDVANDTIEPVAGVFTTVKVDTPESHVVTTETGPPTVRRRLVKTFLRIGGVLILSAVMFGAGVVAAAWNFGILTADVPKASEIVVADAQPLAPPVGMAYVQGGEFLMGSDVEDQLSRPAHAVKVAPFYIDLTEVTNEAYAAFVNSTRHDPPSGWVDGRYPEDRGKFPVTGVTWYDAAEYAAWVGKRLPTEAEWEFAARGSDGRVYPWGNEWDAAFANADKTADGIRTVGQGGRSPFGLFDMSGNAWEWTSSDARAFPGGKAFPRSRLRMKIIRGGNWQSDSRTATAVFRGYYGAAGELEYNGTSFRCVKDIARD